MSNFSAVVVGINKYKDAPLRGCINDSVIYTEILKKKYNVPSKDIRMVLDARATKNNILERLEWLATNETPQKFFSFSGHGASIPIQTYEDRMYEPDGMNELICPFDFSWAGTYILDNDIDRILSKMKKEHHMTLIFDSCHSGGMDRNSFLEQGVNNTYIARTIPTPLDLLSRDNTSSLTMETLGMTLDEAFNIDSFNKEENKKVIKDKAFSSNNISIVTGCRSDQTSADAYFNNRFQGALSYFMQGILLREPHISLKELRKKCALQLNNDDRFSQIPQLIASEENVNKPFIQV